MTRFSRTKKEALRAQGLWQLDNQEPKPRQDVGGVSEFVRLANLANEHIPKDDYDDDDWCNSDRFEEYVPDVEVLASKVSMASMRASDTGYDGVYLPVDDTFDKDASLTGSFFLALAHRAASTHGLEAASELYPIPECCIPESVYPFLESFDGFSVGTLQFRMRDLTWYIKMCLRSAIICFETGKVSAAIDAMLLPSTNRDSGFIWRIAGPLSNHIAARSGISVSKACLVDTLFSGFIPKQVKDALEELSYDEASLLRQMFWAFKDAQSFEKFILREHPDNVLRGIGVYLPRMSPVDMLWHKSVRDLCHDLRPLMPQCSSRATQLSRDLFIKLEKLPGSMTQLAVRQRKKGIVYDVPKIVPPSERFECGIASFHLSDSVFTSVALGVETFVYPEEALLEVGPDDLVPEE